MAIPIKILVKVRLYKLYAMNIIYKINDKMLNIKL